MTPAEIRTMDETVLDQQLTDLHKEWRDLRFAEAVGKLSETHRIREIRKDIARIHTIRTERQIAQAVAAGESIAHRRKDRKRR